MSDGQDVSDGQSGSSGGRFSDMSPDAGGCVHGPTHQSVRYSPSFRTWSPTLLPTWALHHLLLALTLAASASGSHRASAHLTLCTHPPQTACSQVHHTLPSSMRIPQYTDAGQLSERGGGHQKGVTSLAFSARGSYLASGGLDSKICIWSSNTQKLLHYVLVSVAVLSLDWVPQDEDLLLCGLEDGSIISVFLSPVSGFHSPPLPSSKLTNSVNRRKYTQNCSGLTTILLNISLSKGRVVRGPPPLHILRYPYGKWMLKVVNLSYLPYFSFSN